MIPRDILKKVRRIEIATRKSVNDVMAGEYHSVFKGRGMEFDEVREYIPGDDIRTIDWNVTARTGSAHVKRFVEERELTVMLLVDASSSGDFGSGLQMKGELAVELCAVLAFSAIKNNDRVGLIIFTDQVERFLPPKKGRKHVLRVIRELLYFKPAKRKTDIAAALEHLNRIIKRRSVVFLVSDFIDSNLRKPLAIANKRHDLVAITVSDPREQQLPAMGIVELEDAETGEVVLIDTFDRRLRESFASSTLAETVELDGLLRVLSIDSIDVRTDQPYTEPLVRFFRQRAKRY
jgi:uncharacterized protein (DUF58 family)